MICPLIFSGQIADSIKYTVDFQFNEGIYISYLDFRMNKPISKDILVSNEKREQLDFIGKTIENSEYIVFQIGGKDFKIKTDSIWGFCQNNNIFINHDKKMFRIPVFGNISQLIVTQEIETHYPNGTINSFYYNYGMTMGGVPPGATEMKQMILDFYSGNLMEYSPENVEEILKRDAKLHSEFVSLSRSKRRQKMSSLLRTYNLQHPVYFPKN